MESSSATVSSLTSRSATSGTSPHSSGPVSWEVYTVALSMKKFKSALNLIENIDLLYLIEQLHVFIVKRIIIIIIIITIIIIIIIITTI